MWLWRFSGHLFTKGKNTPVIPPPIDICRRSLGHNRVGYSSSSGSTVDFWSCQRCSLRWSKVRVHITIICLSHTHDMFKSLILGYGNITFGILRQPCMRNVKAALGPTHGKFVTMGKKLHSSGFPFPGLFSLPLEMDFFQICSVECIRHLKLQCLQYFHRFVDLNCMQFGKQVQVTVWL